LFRQYERERRIRSVRQLPLDVGSRNRLRIAPARYRPLRNGCRQHLGRARAEGKKIVFTNGVFDLLHPGHVRYLQRARTLGDALIVAINSDRSVRAVKGPDRPINPETERAEILAALACVDAVAIFDEQTPHDVISAIAPDVLVKGADWAENAIVGRDIVEARGGRVVRATTEEGYSTTSIVAKIRGLDG
jgi:rfaE bifunctional protein nucleotidyltransferase chain/domain